MSVHTFSSRDFTRDVSSAKRATAEGPVFITDRGRPAYALLTIEDYYSMVGQGEPSLLAVMEEISGGNGFEFEAPRLDITTRTAELE